MPVAGSNTLAVAWTLRSHAVKVPSVSMGKDAGSTTSASIAVAVIKQSTTTMNSAPLVSFRFDVAKSGSSPKTMRPLIRSLSMASLRSTGLKMSLQRYSPELFQCSDPRRITSPDVSRQIRRIDAHVEQALGSWRNPGEEDAVPGFPILPPSIMRFPMAFRSFFDFSHNESTL